MKQNFKFLAPLVGILMIASLTLPNSILARNGSDNKPENPGQQNFCSLLANLTLKFDQRIANQETKLAEKKEKIAEQLKERWQKRGEQLVKRRTKWDENWTKHYQKLLGRADTDAEKQAVETFKNTIDEAIAKRRAAVDAANKAFQESIEQARLARKSDIETIVKAFKESAKAAYNSAKTDCDAGKEAKTIRETLNNALKAAREKFNTDRQATEKLGPEQSEIMTARNEAIKKAFDEFKATLKTAKETLKAAFGEESEED